MVKMFVDLLVIPTKEGSTYTAGYTAQSKTATFSNTVKDQTQSKTATFSKDKKSTPYQVKQVIAAIKKLENES